MARHSWVNSSMMLSMRNLRPSWVRSSTKSYDQTSLGRSARSRMHDPSFSHRRPRLGCLTTSPGVDHRHHPLRRPDIDQALVFDPLDKFAVLVLYCDQVPSDINKGRLHPVAD